MTQGRIVEQGTHDELLERKSAYWSLVEAQRIAAANENKDHDEVVALDERDEQVRNFDSEKSHSLGSDPSHSDDPDPAVKLTRTRTGKSESSIALQKKPAEQEPKYSLWTLIRFVASFNKTEWHYMLTGLFWSIIAGGGNPTQAVFFAKSIAALSLPPILYAELRSQ